MLGKLIKHEFRATGRVFLPMYAIFLVMALITRLFYARDLFGSLNDSSTGLMIARVVIAIVMVMGFTALWVVTFVLILRRFWTNLLGREGYLMNVLPVSPWEHVAAKLTVSVAWYILSGVCTALALMIAAGGLVFQSIQWEQFAELWNGLWSALGRYGARGQAVMLCVQGVLTGLLMTAQSVLTAYAAMCLGQLVNRHRVLLSIAAYFGLSTAINALRSTLTLGYLRDGLLGEISFGPDVSNLQGSLAAANMALLPAWLVCAGCCGVLFFISQLLLKKELNLQ